MIPTKGTTPTKLRPAGQPLKRKDFVAMASFTETDACKPNFMDRVAAVYRTTAPFVAFLTKAGGFKF